MTAVAIFGICLSTICLLPFLLYGYQGQIFYSNPIDKLNYISIASGIGAKTFSELSNLATSERSIPILAAAANLFARPTAPLLLSKLAVFLHQGSAEAVIPFEAVLQATSAFGVYFFLRNSFLVGRPMAIFCATAFSIGFFPRYILDIDALSSLSALSFAPLLLALVHRMARGAPSTKLSAATGLIAGAILYFYPESALALLIPSLAISVFFLFRDTNRLMTVFYYGVALVVAGILTLSIWRSTLGFLVQQVELAHIVHDGWYPIFDKFFLGDIGSNAAPSLYKYISVPINAAMGFLGLFFLAPPAWLPYTVKLAWKMTEGAFVVWLFAAAFVFSVRGKNAAIFIACLMSAALPIALCMRRDLWAAGKAVTIISPIIFPALVLTICARRWSGRCWQRGWVSPCST